MAWVVGSLESTVKEHVFVGSSQRYLRIRRIKPSTINFLHRFMIDKNNKKKNYFFIFIINNK